MDNLLTPDPLEADDVERRGRCSGPLPGVFPLPADPARPTLARIFPRTALDPGVQYTISTTVHYVVLILAGLIGLNILGFPLTNLALVAGALGVGIGFGLQNIVNNFLSGLILLFERPIKVGECW